MFYTKTATISFKNERELVQTCLAKCSMQRPLVRDVILSERLQYLLDITDRLTQESCQFLYIFD